MNISVNERRWCDIFNYSKLKGRIIEKYGSQKAFAEAICRNKSSVSMILSSKAFLAQKEIVKWAEALDIDQSDYGEYFFALRLDEMQQKQLKGRL